EVPPHLHLKQLNAHIPPAAFPVVIPTDRPAWPRGSGGRKRRIAGVSSFGLSGTNAHMIVEEAPPERVTEAEAPPPRPLEILPLSAKSESALAELQRRYTSYLETTSEQLGDICYTAGAGRSHFPHRLAIVAPSTAELRVKLGQATGTHAQDARKVAFLFSGQG